MELKDFLVTPIYLIIIYVLAYIIRHNVSDEKTRRYFIPALSVKVLGAISLGLIYQFYYGTGDTFNYFNHGSRWIWEAFLDDPAKAFQLIFVMKGNYIPELYEYSSKIWFYRDLPSYFVVRVAGFFDLFTYHTYSATAVLFAVLSFSGLWAMYRAFQSFFPMLHKEFALAVFFIPSVFFWGSGIMKDTLTLGAMGWATYAIIQLFFEHRRFVSNSIILLLSCFVIYSIKIYILLCFLPAVILWVFFVYYKKIRNNALKIAAFPLVTVVMFLFSYFIVQKIGEDNSRYSLDSLSRTAEVTARWLTYVSELEGGSVYSLGDFDYSFLGMIRKFPRAVWVSLFQPHIWEVKNPVMLLSAFEGVFMLWLTFWVLLTKKGFRKIFSQTLKYPVILFCFSFSISFAFAIGISTYNYGTLVRYKIPMIPFYVIGLYLVNYYTQLSEEQVTSD